MTVKETILSFYGLREARSADVGSLFSKQPTVVEEVTSTRLIGIEVEVENHDAKNPVSGSWHMEVDGSLRNTGVEWISSPLEAKWGPYALRELMGECLGKDCCFSPRTSIHIHVNVQDLDREQVIDSVLLYSVFEPLFYRYTGRGRIKNIYCVPLFDTNLLTSIGSRSLESTRESWSKYSGLNLLPIGDKGTLEFRHMHGTFDHKKVSIWIRLLTKLVDYVDQQKTKNIRQMVLSMDRSFDYLELLKEIFGTDYVYLKYQNYYDIANSINNVKQAFVRPATTTRLLSSIKKTSLYFQGVK